MMIQEEQVEEAVAESPSQDPQASSPSPEAVLKSFSPPAKPQTQQLQQSPPVSTAPTVTQPKKETSVSSETKKISAPFSSIIPTTDTTPEPSQSPQTTDSQFRFPEDGRRILLPQLPNNLVQIPSDTVHPPVAISMNLNDIELALEVIEPLAVRQKIQEQSDDIEARVETQRDIDCFSGFDQLFSEAVFVNSGDKDFFTGTKLIRYVLNHSIQARAKCCG
jgi:hypothetical protein